MSASGRASAKSAGSAAAPAEGWFEGSEPGGERPATPVIAAQKELEELTVAHEEATVAEVMLFESVC